MTVPAFDLSKAKRACIEGDLDAFAAAGVIGWALTEQSRRALLESLTLYEVDSTAAILAGLAHNEVVRLQHLHVGSRSRQVWRQGCLGSPAFARLRTLEINGDGAGIVQLFADAELPALFDLRLGERIRPAAAPRA